MAARDAEALRQAQQYEPGKSLAASSAVQQQQWRCTEGHQQAQPIMSFEANLGYKVKFGLKK